MTKISQLSSIGDSLAVDDQFLIRDVSDGSAPNKSVTVSGITRALDVGTAAAPAIAFATDKNTGIYSPGADQVAISTGGAERLRITSAGLVGIGTFAPNARLQVDAPSGGRQYSTSVLDFSNIHLEGSTSNSATSALTFASGGGGGAAIAFSRGAGYDTGISFWTNPGTPVGNAATQRMVINAAGNVGIGTTSPAGKCVVRVSNNTGAPIAWNSNFLLVSNGDTSTSSGIGFSVDGSDSSASISALTPGTTWLKQHYRANSHVFWYGDAGVTQAATIDTSGRLLVGTSSYTGNSRFVVAGLVGGDVGLLDLRYTGSRPTVADITVSEIRFGSSDLTANTAYARIIAESDGASSSGSDIPGRLVFSTTADGASSPTERMRIDNAGLIIAGSSGTNGMKALLLYSGQINTSGGLFTLRTVNDNNGGYFQAMKNAADSIIGTISQSGTTGVAYNTTSDYRLKENVERVADGITRLQQLKPSRFNFIADPGKTVDGFIAHEVQEVVPEAITGEKDAIDDDGNPVYQGIDQSKLVPLLTAALQEAIGRIETLEAEVAALKAQ